MSLTLFCMQTTRTKQFPRAQCRNEPAVPIISLSPVLKLCVSVRVCAVCVCVCAVRVRVCVRSIRPEDLPDLGEESRAAPGLYLLPSGPRRTGARGRPRLHLTQDPESLRGAGGRRPAPGESHGGCRPVRPPPLKAPLNVFTGF